MSGARFVRFYPSDWRSGCIGLTLEQEGFYIRICAFIYDTDQRLPVGDDSMAAKLMGLHTNAYRKIRDQLVALGKLVERAGYWTVPRADRELAAATSNQARAQERQADQNTGRETCQDTIGDTHPNSPQETHQVFPENVNKINGALKSQEPIVDKKKEYTKPVRSEYEAAPAMANGPDEIAGLNGSTGEIVNGVARFLNQLAPDYVTARRVIASNVGIYGDRAVRDGYAELMADVADNKVRVPSVKALLGYFKTASERPGRRPDKPVPSDFASQRIERARSFTAKLNVGTAA